MVVSKFLHCSTLSEDLLSFFILWLWPTFWSRNMTMYLLLSAFTSSPFSLLATTAIEAPSIPCTKSHVPFPLLRSYKRINPGPWHMHVLCNKASFYGEELLAPCPTPKLEEHLLSAVCDCLFNIITAAFHIGGHSSIHNLRMWHPVVTGPTYLGLKV